MFYTPTVKPCKYGGLGCNTETGRCSFIFLSVSILEVFQVVQEWGQLLFLIDIYRSSGNTSKSGCNATSAGPKSTALFWKGKLQSLTLILRLHPGATPFSFPLSRCFPNLGGVVLLSRLFQASFSLLPCLFDVMASIVCSFCVKPQFPGQNEGHRLAQPRGWAILTPDTHTARVQCVK